MSCINFEAECSVDVYLFLLGLVFLKPFSRNTCSYLLQKYKDGGSFVLPVDPRNKETWGDSEHRLAYVSETTVIHKDIVQVMIFCGFV